MRPGGFETTTSHTEKVRVLRLTGEPVELAVASEATVHELKLLLNETCDVPYFCQKVMLGHSLLQSTDALSSLPFPISLTLVVDSFHPEVAPVLQEAARHGDLRAVEQALSAPADPNQADEHGWTPLILAAHAGHGEVLCELGANKEKARTGGYTPLLIACREGPPFQRFVIPAVTSFRDCPCQHGRHGEVEVGIAYKCRWRAPLKGHAPVVKLLCEMRADKEHAAMHGWTPLLLAARHGHNAVTKARLIGE
ncbi:KIDINS220 [Symbiodinium sp. KB8]|nr:KIDINS220 [Symbiodinium sp. KB8]